MSDMQTTQTHLLSAVSIDITPDGDKHRAVDRLELISAYFDGEFESSDVELLSSALPQANDLDPLEHKEDWAIYALIADSLSQPATRAFSPSVEFTARLSAALQREPVHLQAVDTAGKLEVTSVSQIATVGPSVWARWFSWPSLAMAAAVAAVVWVAQPLLIPDEIVVATTPTAVTQPPANGQMVSDYANAHRQFSGPIAVRQASFEPEVER
jgi:sigma-E factor negative regulatory protein RseA